MDSSSIDQRVRTAAFAFLRQQTTLRGDVLPFSVLSREFAFEGTRVALLGPQGIFRPAILPDMPLSITTAPPVPGRPPPYNDGMDSDGLLSYRYRGTDPAHRDNVGLRLAMQHRVPLIYFFGIEKGQYLPAWPVYVVADNPGDLRFTVAVDDKEGAATDSDEEPVYASEARRNYITTLTRRRLHQATFRQRVLRAYHERCTVCRLAHTELLEAAHIIPDTHPRGEPVVSNGLALCKIHHAAFDLHILGIRPDLVVEIRADILAETDGPMLRHGLQEMAGRRLEVPRAATDRPRRDYLEERYALFRRAG
jgi:putative restriction endonuclease